MEAGLEKKKRKKGCCGYGNKRRRARSGGVKNSGSELDSGSDDDDDESDNDSQSGDAEQGLLVSKKETKLKYAPATLAERKGYWSYVKIYLVTFVVLLATKVTAEFLFLAIESLFPDSKLYQGLTYAILATLSFSVTVCCTHYNVEMFNRKIQEPLAKQFHMTKQDNLD